MKTLIISFLKSISKQTGVSLITIVFILGIVLTGLSLSALISFYFAYKARQRCQDAKKDLLPYTALFVVSIVLYVASYFRFRWVLIPAALGCNLTLIGLSYKYCKSVQA